MITWKTTVFPKPVLRIRIRKRMHLLVRRNLFLCMMMTQQRFSYSTNESTLRITPKPLYSTLYPRYTQNCSTFVLHILYCTQNYPNLYALPLSILHSELPLTFIIDPLSILHSESLNLYTPPFYSVLKLTPTFILSLQPMFGNSSLTVQPMATLVLLVVLQFISFCQAHVRPP